MNDFHSPTDYDTYLAIMQELTEPILAPDLDDDTIKRLYESKLVYLENLRRRCFQSLNTLKGSSFKSQDYLHIMAAIKNTRNHLRMLVLRNLHQRLF